MCKCPIKIKRPIEFRVGVESKNGGCSSMKTLKGVFHEWGTDIVEYESTVSHFTVGICESEDGFVCLVNPEQIKFIK